MKNRNALGTAAVLLGGGWLLRRLGWLLLLPVVVWAWWETGTAGLVKLGLAAFFAVRAAGTWRRLQR